ncbi:MAG: hypothetical protein HY615_05805 [Candidatus Rokubacteria bacterium]|nr:hypothetical protein [Candidatus Rokubacteria bacterium]
MTARRVLAGITALAAVAVIVAAVAAGVRSSRVEETDRGVGDITITTEGLRPRTLSATVDRAVTFLNRAGARVHIEFANDDGHRLFEIGERVSAVFHRPGRHPYVVHVGADTTLRGVVDVEDDPQAAAGQAICRGVTIKETCVEL